jgi:hypothetical protein
MITGSKSSRKRDKLKPGMGPKKRLQKKLLEREYQTIEAMIGLSCRERHGTGNSGPCPACDELLAYAKARLDQCPYQEEKPACGRCPIHCYKPDMKKRIQDVMRYAGPLMIRWHPFLTIRHLFLTLKTGLNSRRR